MRRDDALCAASACAARAFQIKAFNLKLVMKRGGEMLQFAISLVFGLTVGVIMSLMLWLNTSFNLTEFVVIVGFVFIGCTVWTFTDGRFTDLTLIALLVVWTLSRILFDRKRTFEKLLTFAMSTTLVLNYYIYLRFIGLRVLGEVKNGDISQLSYMLVYLVIVAAAFFIVFIQKISFFNNAWVRDFFSHEDKRMKNNRTAIFSFLMVLTVVIVFGIYMSTAFVSETENAMFYIGFEFFFSLVYIFISFIMMKMLVEYYILSDISEQEKQHQKELKSFIKMIRAQRHDFNLHLHAVNGLLEAEKYDECRAYVSKMVSETEYVNEVLPIHDTSISAMLYAYRSDAENNGIKMTFDITTNLRGLALEGYEINRIIGNLLQNAIDALTEQTDREYGIVVKMYDTADSAVIDVSNKFFGSAEELSHFCEYSYSGKRNHEGLGLSTVQRIAESYKGVAYVEVDEDVIHFIVRLPKRSKK